MEHQNVWLSYEKEDQEKLQVLCEKYKQYLDWGKTERECIRYTIRLAKEAGYRDIKEVIRNREVLEPGDRVYVMNMEKAVVLFQIGRKS